MASSAQHGNRRKNVLLEIGAFPFPSFGRRFRRGGFVEKQPGQAGKFEHGHHVLVRPADAQVAAGVPQSAVVFEEDAHPGRADVVDPGEIELDLPVTAPDRFLDGRTDMRGPVPVETPGQLEAENVFTAVRSDLHL